MDKKHKKMRAEKNEGGGGEVGQGSGTHLSVDSGESAAAVGPTIAPPASVHVPCTTMKKITPWISNAEMR